jgi:hypothetical protein
MGRRAVALVIAAALALVLPAGDAAGFMRPKAARAEPRVDGDYTCRIGTIGWDVHVETRNGIVAADLVARAGAVRLQAVGLLREGRLLMAIGNASDGGGFAVYRFAADGAHGEYSHFAKHESLGEELISAGPLDGPPGTYDWIARTPGRTPTPLGSGGSGRLEVTVAGKILHFDWRNGLTGIGLRSGPLVVVGWGSAATRAAVSLAPAADGWRGTVAVDDESEPLDVALVRKA